MLGNHHFLVLVYLFDIIFIEKSVCVVLCYFVVLTILVFLRASQVVSSAGLCLCFSVWVCFLVSLLCVVCVCWVFGVFSLSFRFRRKIKTRHNFFGRSWNQERIRRSFCLFYFSLKKKKSKKKTKLCIVYYCVFIQEFCAFSPAGFDVDVKQFVRRHGGQSKLSIRPFPLFHPDNSGILFR